MARISQECNSGDGKMCHPLVLVNLWTLSKSAVAVTVSGDPNVKP